MTAALDKAYRESLLLKVRFYLAQLPLIYPFGFSQSLASSTITTSWVGV
jgi:hypothetical protein